MDDMFNDIDKHCNQGKQGPPEISGEQIDQWLYFTLDGYTVRRLLTDLLNRLEELYTKEGYSFSEDSTGMSQQVFINSMSREGKYLTPKEREFIAVFYSSAEDKVNCKKFKAAIDEI